MDKFDGIKRTDVTVKRNTYGLKKKRGKFIRIAVAIAIVLATLMITRLSNYDVAGLFKQDYVEQYAKD